MLNFIIKLFLFFLTIIPILISVAYFILAERKVMASIQRRKGPNVIGIFGILQPFIDAVKLITKEHIFPNKANIFLFWFGPLTLFIISIFGWIFIPFNTTNFYYDFSYGFLYFLAFSSISIIGLFIAGWASNSRYSYISILRAVAQFVSYELILTISVFPIILLVGSLNFIEIVEWQINSSWFIFSMWPLAYLFFIASLAETNRTPFDLVEAEAELVAGYNTEYSSVFFIFFMFAEYSNILLMSSVFSLLFLGGWNFLFFNHEFIFAFKITMISSLFIFIRATQPRFRFDQLMILCWKQLLPLSASLLIIYLYFYFFLLYDNYIKNIFMCTYSFFKFLFIPITFTDVVSTYLFFKIILLKLPIYFYFWITLSYYIPVWYIYGSFFGGIFDFLIWIKGINWC